MKRGLKIGSGTAAASLAWIFYNDNTAKADSWLGLFQKQEDYMTPIPTLDGSTVIPWTAPTRESQIQRLRKEEFDVLVIGGGAVGSGCALDAVTRGLNVGLVEQADYAAGSSSRSTKLIHGGVRYLESFFLKQDFRMYALVEEALRERSHMLQAAPYMNHPVPIMIPIYSYWEVPYMWVGTKVYDFVAGRRRYVPPSHYINKTEAIYRFPMLESEGLRGAIVYYDGQMNDARMNLMIAMTATQKGAAICNHTEVVSLLKNSAGKVCGARVRDCLTKEEYDINAKTVINATGVFSDSIRQMADDKVQKIIVSAGGVHIVLPDHFCPDRMGLIVPKTRDGRVLFFLPWEGNTLAGTTDSEAKISMYPEPTDEEINFIIDEANRFLNVPVTRKNVKAAWCGLRPLVIDPKAKGTKEISREHVTEVLPESGLITIAGGKWTTYRQMAEDAVDAALIQGGLKDRAKKCCTQAEGRNGLTLLGADRVGVVCDKKFDRIKGALRDDFNLDKGIADHLTHNYGTRAFQIAHICHSNPKKAERLHIKHPFTEAEVIFVVQQEYALTIEDVLGRRLRLSFLDSEACAQVVPRVANIMARELNWSSKKKEEEIENAMKFLYTMHCGNDYTKLNQLAKRS